MQRATSDTVEDDGAYPKCASQCLPAAAKRGAVSGCAARAELEMLVIGKRGAVSSGYEPIAAAASSLASRCAWPLSGSARNHGRGGWASTKPEAERYSTLVRVDTQ